MNVDAEGFVDIRHPEGSGVARVTPDAFEEVWKDKGWELVGDGTRPAAFDVDKALKDELIAEAERLGLDASGKADDLRDRIRKHTEEATA